MNTFLNKYIELVNSEDGSLLPNITVSLSEGVFVYFSDTDNNIYPTKNLANGIQNIKSPTGDFQYLLKYLGYIILHGRTTNLIPYDRYIENAPSYPLNGSFKSFN